MSWSRRSAWPASRRSQVSRLCAEIDERVQSFLERPIEGDWPYLWIDATYVKVREAGRIVSVAVTIAVAVNTDGRREVLGMAIGASAAELFWVEFLRKLKRWGQAGDLRCPRGNKAAVARVFRATSQRCPVDFMRNALAHAGAFCGFLTADEGRKKNVPGGQTGGANEIRTTGPEPIQQDQSSSSKQPRRPYNRRSPALRTAAAERCRHAVPSCSR